MIKNNKNKSLLVTFSKSRNIKDLRHLIGSVVIIDFPLIENLIRNENILYYKNLGLKNIIIIRVLKNSEYQGLTSERIFCSKILNVFLCTVNYIDLFKHPLFQIDVLEYTKRTELIYFLFEDVTWNSVVLMFRSQKILISGGSTASRHLVSPLQLRLIKLLIPMEMSGIQYIKKVIKESFHGLNLAPQNERTDLTENGREREFSEWREQLGIKLFNPIFNINKLNKKDSHTDFNLNSNLNSESNSNSNSESNIKEDLLTIEKTEEIEIPQITDINLNLDKDKEKKDVKDETIKTENYNIETLKRNDCIFQSSLFNNQKRQFHNLIRFSLQQEHLNKESVSIIEGKNKKEVDRKDSEKKTLSEVKNKVSVLDEGIKIKKSKSKYKENIVFTYLDEISKIIENNPENLITAQKQIETLWIIKMKDKLEDPKFLNHRLAKLLLRAKETLEIYSKHYTFKKRFPLLYKELNKIEYLLITFSVVMSYHFRVGHTTLSMIVGNNIIYNMYKEKYKGKMLEMENLITYNQYKDLLGLNKEQILKIGAFFIDILTIFPANIFERSIHYDESKYGELAILAVNSELLEDIKNNIIIPPSSLPMICEPNRWSDNIYGGFLENKFEQNDLITGSGQHKHLVESKENLYKSINYLNSIKFAVNTNLLKFLENEGQFLLDIDEKDLTKSELLQRQITLAVAKTFENIPFYINTHADFRGRIYTQSFFLSYQSGDLSSGLLQFHEGEKLNERGLRFLYIYGANLYNENNLRKSSYNERVLWVKDNYNNILKMEPDFLSKAESKFLFAAFSLILRELDKKADTLVYFPIFLDATCSGIQHFSALLKDLDLGNKVNLKTQTDIDKVEDIYSEMVEPINKAINAHGQENHDFVSLSLVKLNRKLLKPLIMTKLYNSTPFGMAQQLKSNLIKEKSSLHTKLLKDLKYQVPGKDGILLLNNFEIFKIGQIVHEQIFKLYPSLKAIYSYFIDIVRLMINLNIPVIWITPSGLKITQSYARSTLNKVAINMAGKTKSMVLREWTENLDKGKQIQAIIPNIIHSLDASHLINLLCLAENEKFKPIISIHDCFGTHPNKLEDLSFMVKREFVLLYTRSNFLQTFQKRILQSIKDNQYLIEDDKENKSQFIILNRKKHYIPEIPKLGSLDLKNILESRYMIT